MNTGDRNTGDCNTGHCNTGHWNTGDCNTGDQNTGDQNTGDRNTGDRNTGDRNTGDRNTGNWNTGHRNTGDQNTGDRNTGDRNTGDRNTGDRNTGNWNTGNWNTGHRNTGYFCVKEGPVMFFDRACNMSHAEAIQAIPDVALPVACAWVPSVDMTHEEQVASPAHTTTGGFLRKFALKLTDAFPLAWAKLDLATKSRFIALPNFDADKFLQCTGVDVRLDAALHPQPSAAASPPIELTIDGHVYRRVN